MIVLKILACGSRDWTDAELIEEELNKAAGGVEPWQVLVIEGGARGADTLAKKAARNLGFHVAEIDAVWTTYGKAAGPMRNRVMLDLEPHLVLAFHEHIEKSKGTADNLDEATKRGLKTRLVAG